MKKLRVLVVDDDDLFSKSIRKELDRAGYLVRVAGNGEEALAELRSVPPDVILLDIRLPDRSGLDLLHTIRERDPSVEVIMLTAYGSIDTAVESLQRGAFHYLVKPAKLSEIESLIQKAFESRTLKIENLALKRQIEAQSGRDVIIGKSEKLHALLSLVEKVAPTNQTVLIQGESGTGKELIARRIHRLSARHAGPFVIVDCASLNRSLLESELFGHEKGAFTGAVAVKHGLVEAADSGTLFVDEVGSLEMEMQSDFLRLLETQEYRRVGATATRKADLRIVAATNTDLAAAVHDGKFREDLFFRLSVIVLQVPPLRDRKEDLPILCEHFLGQNSYGTPKRLSARSLKHLQEYRWPGNVRELKNVLERASLLSEGDIMEPEDLRLLQTSGDRLVKKLVPEEELVTLREVHSRYIRHVLSKVEGHQLKAAKILGIDPKTIYRTLKQDEQ